MSKLRLLKCHAPHRPTTYGAVRDHVRRGGARGQIALEFMMVVWLFIILFAATFELALYCTKGELFILSGFMAGRSMEVNTSAVAGPGEGGGLAWNSNEVQRAGRIFLNEASAANADMLTTEGFAVDGEAFREPEQITFSYEYTHEPLTAMVLPMSIHLDREIQVTLQTQHQRQLEEDNCLPGACLP